ncbi:MAG: prenyltransferase [Candidatus Eremiobacteraeota bacterium]|nr:prenyltransferase [Candidatus Eremiobacteraeota bacterium]
MIAAFLRLSRLKFLTGGLICVAFGACLAAFIAGHWVIPILEYLIAQITVTTFQLMTHYTNDYFDREGDKLTTQTDFSGGSGVLNTDQFRVHHALVAAAISAGAASLALASLGLMHKTRALELGIAIGLLAYSYSSPPFRLLARGMGELTTAFVVAVLVPLFALRCGTEAALSSAAILSLLPGACAMFIMMLCVQYPDLEADAATGKRNLVVRLGRIQANKLIRAAAITLCVCVLGAVIAGAPWTLLAFSGLSAPLLISVVRLAQFADGASLQPNARLAAAGVTLFLITIGFNTLAYAAML